MKRLQTFGNIFKVLLLTGLTVMFFVSCGNGATSVLTPTEVPSFTPTPTPSPTSTPTPTNTPTPTSTPTDTPTPTNTPTPTPSDGVTVMSLYKNRKDLAKRVKYGETYETAWVAGTDITSFEAIASEAAEIANNGRYFQDIWRDEWEKFENPWVCKIGYFVEFDLVSGEHIEQMLMKPGDELRYREYLENYLYDDIHQVRGQWYYHLLESDINDDLIMSSCKFTAGQKVDQIAGKIKVTAFVYRSDDDFDENGYYIGPLSYSVTMINTAYKPAN